MTEEIKIEDIIKDEKTDALVNPNERDTQDTKPISEDVFAEKKSFIVWLRGVFSARHGADMSNPALLSPRRDWRIVLWSFAGVVILIIVGVSFLMFSINSDEIYVVESNNDISSEYINKKLLSEALFLFEKREKEFQSLLVRPTAVLDPAL